MSDEFKPLPFIDADVKVKQIDGNRTRPEAVTVETKRVVELTNDVGWPIYCSAGLADVMQERVNQLEQWDDEHDDGHEHGSIGLAAACLAAPGPIYSFVRGPGDCYSFVDPWPWLYPSASAPTCDPMRSTQTEKKKRTRREQLVVAAALIIAEIDRIDRAKDRDSKEMSADDEV